MNCCKTFNSFLVAIKNIINTVMVGVGAAKERKKDVGGGGEGVDDGSAGGGNPSGESMELECRPCGPSVPHSQRVLLQTK